MQCVALTGINRDVIEDVNTHQVRTIELRSAHNIFSLVNMNLGDAIFMTSTGLHDISSGTSGLLVVVRARRHERHAIRDVEDARRVLGAFHVPAHPIEVRGSAG